MKAVERVTAGNVSVDHTAEDDFIGLYSTAYAPLMRALAFYTGDRELAMDLAQETMARAYRDWKKVAKLDAPAGWLHRVAFNLANSTFRRVRAERRSSERLGAQFVDVQHDADTSDTVTVRRLVAALPPRQKAALVLRYYADMSVGETAAVMDCAEGTVRALTSQALETLRRSGLSVESPEEMND